MFTPLAWPDRNWAAGARPRPLTGEALRYALDALLGGGASLGGGERSHKSLARPGASGAHHNDLAGCGRRAATHDAKGAKPRGTGVRQGCLPCAKDYPGGSGAAPPASETFPSTAITWPNS